jgi:ribosome maturation factor RimP
MYSEAMDQLTENIEERIAATDPEIELIALERPGPEALRIYIDHADGVDLGLCEKVSRLLEDLEEEYAIEVSSPGIDRPLTKPAHFERFLGRRARVRLAEPIEGRRNFTGELSEVDGEEFVLRLDDGESARVPIQRVHRANLVPELSEVSP